MKGFFFLFFTLLIFTSLTAKEERSIPLPPEKPGWIVTSYTGRLWNEWRADRPLPFSAKRHELEEWNRIRSFYEDTCRNQGGEWSWEWSGIGYCRILK